MPTELADVEDFLGHSSQSRGGSYLKNWKDPKKGGAGYIDWWFHRRCSVAVALWRHSFQRYDVVEDEQTREPKRVLRYSTLLCPESEEVIKMQGRHSKQSGELVAPYECCPIHLMLEWLYQSVQEGSLPWLTEVFRFDAGDGKPVVLHAAGLYGGIKDDIGPQKLKEAANLGIYLTNAFKESWKASLNYAFRGVDNDNVKEGVQIAVEPGSLGDHAKVEIREVMSAPNPKYPKRLGPELGNPIKNPWCMEFQAHPEEKEPSKKYSAVKVEVKPTRQVMDLITDTDAPDLTSLTAPPMWASVRATLERAAQVDLPFDEFFAKVDMGQEPEQDDKKVRDRGRVPEVGQRPAQAAPRSAPNGQPRHAPQPAMAARPEPPQSMAEVERFRCENDDCDNVLLATETFCAKCGTPSGAPPPPPPPPAMRKRSEAAQGAIAPVQRSEVGNPGFRPQAVQAQPPRQQAAQRSPARRPAAPQTTAFDEFPHGHNAPQENAPEDEGELQPSDSLPWGRQ